MTAIYTGPSWALSSYPNSKNDKTTNLLQEWALELTNFSAFGSNVLNNIARMGKPCFPIIWVYNEPIGCLKSATGLEFDEFIVRSDWETIWREVNQYCLKKIASLGVPVLLIGAHSDIVDCDYSNITVAHSSWQKFLAEKAGNAGGEWNSNCKNGRRRRF